MRIAGERLVVDATFDGRRTTAMLHTGMPESMIRAASADALGLARRQELETRSYVLDGPAPQVAFIGEARVGDSVHRNWRLAVLEHREAHPVVLGYDLFRQADVELDLQAGVLRLYRTEGCGDANLAYWARAEADRVPLESTQDAGIAFSVQLNGQAVRAELNSAVPHSLVDTGTARRLGTLETFTVAAERVRNPALRPADLGRGYSAGGFLLKRDLQPVQLGLDFLRAHRILVAHSQRRLYFTYTGGPVFVPQ